MIILWIIVIVILTIIEAATVNLTTIWFVGGGIAALGISFLTDNFAIQFGVFVIVGVLLLTTTRPAAVKFLKKKSVPTNADRVINMQGIVTEEIIPTKTGEIRVDGKRWTAFAEERIEEGKIVRVVAIEGVKLKVKEI
jgi:membrane protein implicated in regulation of membrane protease activity